MRDHASDRRAGASDRITISGFDAAEDVLLVTVEPGVDAAIRGQKITRAGLIVRFSTGTSVLLEGVRKQISEDSVTFVEEGTPQIEEPAPSGEVLYYGSYTSGDGDAHSYMGMRSADHITGNVVLSGFTQGTDSIAIESDAPQHLVVTAQTPTDQGLLITLSNGVTITLQGVASPIEARDVVFVPAGTHLP
ncbi:MULTISPECIES: hypothetical protein [Roseobacteraceae]|uniref:Uncharacterized protein n=1 Tax=Pseudosulfitobacter pseudonitzschiae TaxID=1402135 RepID=A0A221JXZ1_9RHOB|nr:MULTISPECIES: hypothetical protein [Roseobacteraceae]ASM71510.1 hypothetical protein SULPSESMR1_00678 [Pseudosulfitobacter pseudonitzschiae]